MAWFVAPNGAPETTILSESCSAWKLDHDKNEDQNFSQKHKFGNQSVVIGSVEMQDQGYARNSHNVIGIW